MKSLFKKKRKPMHVIENVRGLTLKEASRLTTADIGEIEDDGFIAMHPRKVTQDEK